MLSPDATAALTILCAPALPHPTRTLSPQDASLRFWRAESGQAPALDQLLCQAPPQPATAAPAPCGSDPLLCTPNLPLRAHSLAVPPPPEVMASGASSQVNRRIRAALLHNLVSPAQGLLGSAGGLGLLARLAEAPAFGAAAAAVGLTPQQLGRALPGGGSSSGGGGAPSSSRSAAAAAAAAADLQGEAQLLKGKGARSGAMQPAGLGASEATSQRQADLLKKLTLAITQLHLEARGVLRKQRYDSSSGVGQQKEEGAGSRRESAL